MTKVKNYNYITIQGWMICGLGLKGNELLIYAIIYGFSQDKGTAFKGGLQYLADWTNSTKQGVIKTIKKLQEKGLIQKIEHVENGVKSCEYYSTEFNGVLNKVEQGGKQSLTGYSTEFNGGIKQSLPNNINNNILDKLVDKKEEIYKEEKIPYEEIIGCLNRLAGTNYKSTSKNTRELINGRWKEGFRLTDFETVIKKKCDEWINTEWEKYLTPTTLFRPSNFEKYLNGKINKKQSKGGMVF